MSLFAAEMVAIADVECVSASSDAYLPLAARQRIQLLRADLDKAVDQQ